MPQATQSRFSLAVEVLLWTAVVVLVSAFLITKLRSWTPTFDLPLHTDFAVYYTAGRVADINPLGLYRPERWFEITGLRLPVAGPYLYLPSFAELLVPFARLSYEDAGRIWFWLNVVAAGGTVATLLWMWHNVRIGLLGALLWLFLPGILDTIFLGNINIFLAFGVTLVVASFDAERRWIRWAGGILSGVLATVKLFLFALVLVPLAYRRRSHVLGFVIGAAAFVLIGLIVLPPSLWFDYYNMARTTASQMSPTNVTEFWNQSVFAFWDKMAATGAMAVDFRGSITIVTAAQPILTRMQAQVGLLLSLVLLAGGTGSALWKLRSREGIYVAAAWGSVLTFMLMVSPVTWPLHFPILAPIFPTLLALRGRLGGGWRLLIPASYLVVLIQRGSGIWLTYAPIMALSSIGLLGLIGWWAVFVRFAFSTRVQPAGDAR